MRDVRRYGDRSLLCELTDPAEVPGLAAAAASLDGVAEVVPGARTLLVLVDDPAQLPGLAAVLAALAAEPMRQVDSDEVEVRVRYDGPDLAEVAGLTGLSSDEVVERHVSGCYIVRFCGFAPGFAYLDGLDERLHVPRRAEPRTRVPAGSVAIADEFAAVYPRASPGGWRLLGTTDAQLWDADRDPPALLSPGTRVRFVPT